MEVSTSAEKGSLV
nr:unnamed protein product [Callosobruchus chinensis]